MDQSIDLKFNLLTVGSKQGRRQFSSKSVGEMFSSMKIEWSETNGLNTKVYHNLRQDEGNFKVDECPPY
jgi:hypothetical protein